MQIQVRAHNVEVPAEVLELAKRRLSFALGRFENRIARIQVRLTDINGPKSGLDKACQLLIKLHYANELIVECVDSSWEAAICTAADRSGSAVQRELDRRRENRRLPMDQAAVAIQEGLVR
jgi:putative sigma-54 modulation protein